MKSTYFFVTEQSMIHCMVSMWHKVTFAIAAKSKYSFAEGDL